MNSVSMVEPAIRPMSKEWRGAVVGSVLSILVCGAAIAAEPVKLRQDLQVEHGCGVEQPSYVPVALEVGSCVFLAQASWAQGDEIRVTSVDVSCGYKAGSLWTVRGQLRPAAVDRLTEASGPLPKGATPEEEAKIKQVEAQTACLKQRTVVSAAKGSTLTQTPGSR